MQCLLSLLLMIPLIGAVGCTALADRLSHDYYDANYIAKVHVPEVEEDLQREPDLRRVEMRYHDDTVEAAVTEGWELLGTAEFNTSSSPRRNHLRHHAKKLGARRVVHSSVLDRREQEVVKRREYVHWPEFYGGPVQGHIAGRWVETVDVVTRVYHDYRATFLRRAREYFENISRDKS